MLRGITRKNFSLLEVANSGHVLSQLKNLGMAWSEQRWGRGDWLYFSDNDVWFSPGWLEKLTVAAEKTEPLGFRLWGGQVHPFHKPIGEPPSCIGFGCADNDRGKVYVPSPGNVIPSTCVEGLTEHSVLDGPSWFMRWKTWRDFGPFQRTTAPGPCQSEEYPFCQRLIAGGGRIGVTVPHCVIHTGLTQSNGIPAPGAAERRGLIPPGVIGE
jgi:hypothetical protein